MRNTAVNMRRLLVNIDDMQARENPMWESAIDFLFLDKRLKIWHYTKYVCTKMEMSDMTLKEFYDKEEHIH